MNRPTMSDTALQVFYYVILVACLEVRGVLPPVSDDDLVVL